MTLHFIPILLLGLVVGGGALSVEHDPGQGGQKHEMKGGMEGEHGRMRHGMPGYAHTVLMHAEALKLTDEQIGKIVRIKMGHQKQHQERMESLHKSMKAAREGLMDPSTDEAGIRKASKGHAAAFEAMIGAALKARDEIDAVLTPEQKEQLKALEKERRSQAQRHGKH